MPKCLAFSEGGWGGRDQNIFSLRKRNYPYMSMNYKLANDTKIWKGNKNTTKLLFSLKAFEILHQERGGQVLLVED